MPVKPLRGNDWPSAPSAQPIGAGHAPSAGNRTWKPTIGGYKSWPFPPAFPLAACLAWYAPIGQRRSGSPRPPAPRFDKAEGEGRGRASRLSGGEEGAEVGGGIGSAGPGRLGPFSSASAAYVAMKSVWALALACTLLLAGKCPRASRSFWRVVVEGGERPRPTAPSPPPRPVLCPPFFAGVGEMEGDERRSWALGG